MADRERSPEQWRVLLFKSFRLYALNGIDNGWDCRRTMDDMMTKNTCPEAHRSYERFFPSIFALAELELRKSGQPRAETTRP